MKKDKNYEISIVMAIYNMEEYLEEAIESVIHQTIGMKNIQLILVNDGSKDCSLDICKSYSEKFPENIVVINKENGGVSSARNAGLKIAQGNYVNFMDADDKLEYNACEKVLDFFHTNDVDVVSIPLVYFGAKDDEHALNWKFHTTKVINIDDEYESVQMHISSSFIRRQVVQQFSFNTELKYGEDAEVVNKCIFEKRKYGVVADTAYLYRYRDSDDSAMQKSKNSYDNYFPVLRKLYWSLINYEKKLSGKEHISKYLESLILYDLKWKLKRKEVDESVFGSEGKLQFFSEVSDILQEIDDRRIICLDNYSIIYKTFMFSLKYKIPIEDMEKSYKVVSNDKKQFVIWKDFIMCKVSSIKVFIEILDIKNGQVKLEGKIGGPLRNSEIGLMMIVQNGAESKEYSVITKDEWRSDTFALNESIKKRFYFRTPEIEIKDGMQISFQLHFAGRNSKMKIGMARLAKLSDNYVNMYVLEGGYVISRDEESLKFEKYDYEVIKDKEKAFIEEIQSEENADKKTIEYVKKIRRKYIEQIDLKERIWVFMDRPNKADDNAEHLFKYAVQKNDGIQKYFVVSKQSSDYDRLSRYGKVLDYGSPEHQLIMLKAEAIISSHVNNHTYSPFEESLTKYFTGFLTAKRVFLQHGITKDDVSNWLHKLNKNLSLFVTASSYEYNSIVEGKYGYDEGQIVLTGFPRYDNLKNRIQKTILYMPTWDSSVLKMKNDFPVYNPDFKKSRLFQEINGFLNNEKLNEVLEKAGYKILFKPHPNMVVQMKDFQFGENIILADDKLSYQELFAMGSALITDYSSTFFDFAYLKKPVIYYQCRQNHYVDGYFDYEKMGMGEVVKNETELIQSIEKYIKTDFQLEDIYLNRTKDFFKFLDHNNCQRVYQEMSKRF